MKTDGPAVAHWGVGTRTIQVWVVAIVGVLVTCAAALHFAQTAPVYWSRSQVVFIAPKSTVNPNGLQITPSGLIAAAGVVARVVDPRGGETRTASDDVTLAGEGVRHGFSVVLPNSGGQWANNYSQGALDVQAVGSSAEETQATVDHVLSEIQASLAHIQDTSRVAQINRIRIQLSPPVAPIYRQTGSRSRALLATMALGFLLSVAACRAVGRVGGRSSRTRGQPNGRKAVNTG